MHFSQLIFKKRFLSSVIIYPVYHNFIIDFPIYKFFIKVGIIRFLLSND